MTLSSQTTGASVLRLSELCTVFRERASVTHTLIRESYRVSLGISEETLTDVNLVELQVRFPKHVRTRKFTKNEEGAFSGADWLWCFGRPGRWICLSVQAKLCRPHLAKVPNLHYNSGNQHKLLVNYAVKNGCVPLYCLYTGEPLGAFAKACPLAEEVSQLGCGLVRPRHVANMERRKSGKNDKALLLKAATPWACLVCCSARSQELADTVAHAVRDLHFPAFFGGVSKKQEERAWAAAQSRSESSEEMTKSDDDILGDPADLIRDDLPDLVAKAMDPSGDENPPYSAVTVVSTEAIFDDRPRDERPVPKDFRDAMPVRRKR